MPKRFWARLQGEVDCPLRRGAWYPVKKLGQREVVLDVVGESVDVARPSLEIRSTPPNRWSVVHRPKNPVRFGGGTEYAVCPNCRARLALGERLASMRCTGCGETFEVAWEEQYLRGI